jgi:hypothetical protein
MTFEFVIVYQDDEATTITSILRERLKEVMIANVNEIDDVVVAKAIWLNFERRTEPKTDDAGIEKTRTVASFTLSLEIETSIAEIVIQNFLSAVRAPPIQHVVKFENPLLRDELIKRANELFALEMKLRRVLSIIYLNAYREGGEYNLLRDETVGPVTKDLRPEQMHEACENQFFHLTFSHYTALNKRPELKHIPHLIEHIRHQSSYDALRSELTREPVTNKIDAAFIASLKERMDPIEKMRNCIAHNRKPSAKLTSDYHTALPLVDQALDTFLYNAHTDWMDEIAPEMPWESHAREAVELAMKEAKWDEKGRVICFHDLNEPRLGATEIDNREGLVRYLENLAESEWCNYCPRDEGEYVFEPNVESMVEDVVETYGEKIDAIFDRSSDDHEKDE